MFLFQILYGFPPINPLLAMPTHTRRGPCSFTWGREASVHICLLLPGLPLRTWDCFLPLTLLFISSLPLVAEWATATVWWAVRALLLFQEVRKRWPKLTESNVGQIWETIKTIQSRCLSLGTPDILDRESFVVEACPVHCSILGSISGVYPVGASSTFPSVTLKRFPGTAWYSFGGQNLPLLRTTDPVQSPISRNGNWGPERETPFPGVQLEREWGENQEPSGWHAGTERRSAALCRLLCGFGFLLFMFVLIPASHLVPLSPAPTL